MIEPELTAPVGVAYDDGAHTYTIDGVCVPSASTILKVIDPDKYGMIAEDVLMRAAARGSATHRMIALDVRSNLDVGALNGHLVEDYLAWLDFCQVFDFEPTHSERIVASKRFQFCGTLDLAGNLTHKRRRGHWLVDIKRTSARPDLVGPQTAGYVLAAEESLTGFTEKTPRACLWIHDGKYDFIECNNPSDRAAFISGRTILNWRENERRIR